MKRTSRIPSKLSGSLHHRLNAYALAASAAGVSLLALAQPAEAKIVYTPADRTFGGISWGVVHGGSYYLDLNHDGIADFVFAWDQYGDRLNERPAWDAWAGLAAHPLGFSNAIAGKRYRVRYRSYSYNRAFCLASGASIGPQQPFAGSVMAAISLPRGFATGSWLYGSQTRTTGGRGGDLNGYLGLKFAIHGQTHYGWARLNVLTNWDAPALTVSLLGYAYETIPNKPIILSKEQGLCQQSRKGNKHANPASSGTAGPASLGRLTQGASGIAAWRRKE